MLDLDKLKSIQKKMASAQQLQSDVEITGIITKNPQISISMDTAREEILKQDLLSKLKERQRKGHRLAHMLW